MRTLALPMVDTPCYAVTLGDTRPVPPLPPGLRIVPLARPEALVAAVRYVQLPLWKEFGIKASHLSLSIGTADLWATLGDESFASAAYTHFCEHIAAISAELPALCEPNATVSVVPITGFEGWSWQDRFNSVLAGVKRE